MGRFTIFKGETGPSLSEQLLSDGEPVVLGGADTVRLRGRLSGADPSPLLIDALAVIEEGSTGQVRYDWQVADTATAGNLIAWWFITVGGREESTPAFVIPIIDQAAVDQGEGIYADVLDVKALAGFLSKAWDPTSDTSESDIRVFLAMTSGEIDAVIASRGAVLPLDPLGAVALALRSLTADGALVRALGATWPNDAPEGVTELRRDARSRYAAGLAALAAGTHPASLALAGVAATSQGSTLELDDPQYGICDHWDPADYNPSVGPAIHRGQKL